jgi:chemotaxis protein histidine kinase CheA
LLRQAQQNALDRQAKLAAEHDTLEKNLNEEKAQKRIIHKKPNAASKAAETSKATEANTAPAQNANAPGTAPTAGTAATSSNEAGSQDAALSFLKDLTIDQKNLSQLDKRIENEQELAALYGEWINYITLRKRAFMHGILLAAFVDSLDRFLCVCCERSRSAILFRSVTGAASASDDADGDLVRGAGARNHPDTSRDFWEAEQFARVIG